MSYRPLVSILIPTYNSARFVRRAIESAFAQTYQDIEVVVGDNASEDDTYEIAAGYRAIDSRLRPFRNTRNCGPVANWRRCVAEAQGDLVCLLFSDDWYEALFLESLVPFMADDDVAFGYSAVNRIADVQLAQLPGKMASPASETPCPVLFQLEQSGLYPTSRFLQAALTATTDKVPVSPACAIFRREDLRQSLGEVIADPYGIHYDAHGAGPDMWTYLWASLRYPSFAHLRLPLANFLARPGALSTKPITSLAYTLAGDAFFNCYDPLPDAHSRVLAWTSWRLLRLSTKFPAARHRLWQIARSNGLVLLGELPGVAYSRFRIWQRRWC